MALIAALELLVLPYLFVLALVRPVASDTAKLALRPPFGYSDEDFCVHLFLTTE